VLGVGTYFVFYISLQLRLASSFVDEGMGYELELLDTNNGLDHYIHQELLFIFLEEVHFL